MRLKLYHLFVNRIDGITYRYHKIHDNSSGLGRIVSYMYLIWLNVCYYCFFCRFLRKRPEVEYYEVKRLSVKDSESHIYKASNPDLSVEGYVRKLSSYDVISFDVFDTLILRPFSVPSDVFYIIGEKLQIMDFRNIRSWAEWDARVKCKEKKGHMEVKLQDIWKNLAEDVGCEAERGMQIEMETELSLCYANPFMLEVWQRLISLGKRIIIVSDMYLPSSCIAEILNKEGFSGFEKIFVSCEHEKSKAGGDLFELVQKDLKQRKNRSKKKPEEKKLSIVHVGDNPHSDHVMAEKAGWDSLLYQNVNKNAIINRAFDMSFITGSAYRALVSNHLYNGLADYSMEYEYGFIYGGLFVTGYCSFIHNYCKTHGMDRILFLSRDGDILKQVYDHMYPDDDTEYVYWSRKSAVKLMAENDRHDFFRRFIYHKVNQKYTIREILEGMELDFLTGQLGDWKSIWLERRKKEEADSKNLAIIENNFSLAELEKVRNNDFIDLKPDSELTDKNGYLLRRFIEAKWDQVQKYYSRQQKAAQLYYQEKLSGCSKAVAVDIGWAGSGALALSYLTKHVWNIPCDITGIIAGTNTPYNAEPDATEPFLQSGKLVAYMYSHSQNRDLLKKHDPNKDYNVFWELLLSSPTPKFEGFYLTKAEAEGNQKSEKDRSIQSQKMKNDGTVYLCFGKYDANLDGIRDIQQGIWDFAQQYLEHFKEYPYMLNISGRDAYAPMLLAASHNERYLKAIEKKFDLEINVS